MVDQIDHLVADGGADGLRVGSRVRSRSIRARGSSRPTSTRTRFGPAHSAWRHSFSYSRCTPSTGGIWMRAPNSRRWPVESATAGRTVGQIVPGCERVEVFASITTVDGRPQARAGRRIPHGGRPDHLRDERFYLGCDRLRYSRVVIESFGYELAPCVVTSEELEHRLAAVYHKLHVQPGQLFQMTGIQERRYWEPGYTVSEGLPRRPSTHSVTPPCRRMPSTC